MDLVTSYIRRSVLICLFAVPLAFQFASHAQGFEPVYTEAELQQLTPTSDNPYLSLLPSGVTPDYDYWDSALYWAAVNAPAGSFTTKDPLIITEDESLQPPNSPPSNNSIGDAQPIPELGTGTNPNVQILASFRPGTFITTIVEEDNGALSIPGDTRIDPPTPVRTNVVPGFFTAALATIGDGPHGSTGTGHGDIDYYSTGFLSEGVTIEVDIDTLFNGFSGLDSFVILRNAGGEIVDFNDDFDGGDSYLKFYVDNPGVYHISVSSFKFGLLGTESFPGSPFVSGSGGGYETEGDYAITLRVSDLDFFSFDLVEGDVLGFRNVDPFSTAVVNARLINPAEDTILVTDQNASFIYPENHQFQNSAKVHGAVVAPSTGTYTVSFGGSEADDYIVDLEVFRPFLDDTPDVLQQTLYLTFWGTTVYDNTVSESIFAPIPFNPSAYGALFPDVDVALSPFFDFLEPLGFEIDDGEEEADLAIITGFIRDLVQAQMPEVDVRIGIRPPGFASLLSGEILIGGTTSESGFFSLGRAQSIDVGNTKPQESAFVLMDILSGIGPLELNTLDAIPRFDNEFDMFWAVSPTDDAITDLNHDIAYTRLVVTTIANIVAHEAGHFFGNFHTENVITPLNIMDQGGTGVPTLAGFGFDQQFNTFDDIRVTLGPDLYDPSEGFIGTEDTDLTIFFGVGGQNPLPLNFANLFVNFATSNNGIGTTNFPFNELQSAVDVIDAEGTVNISPSSGSETFTGANTIDWPMTIVNRNPAVGPIRIGGEALPRYLKTKR